MTTVRFERAGELARALQRATDSGVRHAPITSHSPQRVLGNPVEERA
jgi:hypothetical protein